MKNEMISFKRNYEVELRTKVDDKGVIWFVAKDVCDMLGLSNASETMKALDEDEQKLTSVLLRSDNGTEQTREVNMLNESGLYHLIFLSRRPEAKAFRRWVTGEVLPRIRRTGSYGSYVSVEDMHRADMMEEFRKWLKFKILKGDAGRIQNDIGYKADRLRRFLKGERMNIREDTMRKVTEWIKQRDEKLFNLFN